MACSVAPSLDAKALSEQIKRCVESRGRSQEWVLRQVDACSDALKATSLTAATGVLNAALIQITGKFVESPAHGAYSVSRRHDGYCLIDQVIDPERGPLTQPASKYLLNWNDKSQRLLSQARA